MKSLKLDGNWKLAVIHDCDLNKEDIPCTFDKVVLNGDIDAIVPGNFEIDLERAGLISDPFFGKNLIKTFRYENAHIFYARKFHFSSKTDTIPVLSFDGLDTIADIYLNGKCIGRAENMFVPHKFEAYDLIEGENEIAVHFHPCCLETRKNKVSAGTVSLKYNYETLRLRKAPHMFGWDIMPRLVSAGIYRPAYIEYKPIDSFSQFYLMTREIKREAAELELFFDIDIGNRPIEDYRIAVKGSCGDSEFSAEERIWFTAGTIQFQLKNPSLWWPKGYGDPNLYNVTITLLKNGNPVDTREIRLGIRTVKLIRTSTTDMFMNGDFHLEVNGRKIFVLGTNWVPIDALHSRDVERIPKALALLDDVGCNTVRCWGGNVYEDPVFYSACDEMGIMVWQDFALACATHPIDPEFCDIIRDEAEQVVRLLRQHPSIILWSGDNECDMFYTYSPFGRNPNINRLTRTVLPEVCDFEDPTRPYLPSSPFIDDEACKLPLEYLPENHLWGPRDYYKSVFYKDSLCNFVSEIGYHGCPSVESIKKFISPESLWPWQDNDEWIIHAASPQTDSGPYLYRIELMAKQIKELFGEVPDRLEDFVLASQISQAEAKKFFVELFRTGQPRRSGIIWWNLIDGWPQFSDAVVDYYFHKKLAYHYLKQSQQPLLLTFKEPSDWELQLVAVNNANKNLTFEYNVTDYESSERVASGTGTCVDASVLTLDALPYSLGEKKIYLIEWECEGYSGKNHYLSGNPPFALDDYRDFLKKFYDYER